MDADEKLYNEVFRGTRAMLEERLRRDPSFDCEVLRGMLESQLIYQGNDWVGRGKTSEIKTEAVIAAYEVVLHEWECMQRSERADAAVREEEGVTR
jgi:hypothetical protein